MLLQAREAGPLRSRCVSTEASDVKEGHSCSITRHDVSWHRCGNTSPGAPSAPTRRAGAAVPASASVCVPRGTSRSRGHPPFAAATSPPVFDGAARGAPRTLLAGRLTAAASAAAMSPPRRPIATARATAAADGVLRCQVVPLRSRKNALPAATASSRASEVPCGWCCAATANAAAAVVDLRAHTARGTTASAPPADDARLVLVFATLRSASAGQGTRQPGCERPLAAASAAALGVPCGNQPAATCRAAAAIPG
mmetsp:Transcript_108929/g.306972  ORF Transcript_108929/g.306972 Transcript_108929/m.306972 type:complete len:254 (-) Transcript_108929:222-983(-)